MNPQLQAIAEAFRPAFNAFGKVVGNFAAAVGPLVETFHEAFREAAAAQEDEAVAISIQRGIPLAKARKRVSRERQSA